MKVKRHDAAALLSELAREPNNLRPQTLYALRCAVACLSGGRCSNCALVDSEDGRGFVCVIDDSSVERFGCCSRWRARSADHHN